jgi:putative transcriptional regulator
MKDTSKRLPVAEQIRKGLEEAIREARGEITLKTTTLELPDRPPPIPPEDLTALRLRSQMSQAVFARLLNVSTKTVQSWEQGDRKPSQAALRLIQVFQNDPDGVLRIAGMTIPTLAPANGGSESSTRAKPARTSRTRTTKTKAKVSSR